MIHPDASSPAGGGPEIVELGAADLPEMTRLVERTQPGPFWPRIRELGTYLGIRENGSLVATSSSLPDSAQPCSPTHHGLVT
ncbi:hypothetical protein [Amycolatopsis australiensis]|uniref:hypothetical protein n=1 Tax=Amycolatopsis australiensis TaxID=546364 RepID=UPI00093048C0|nr:hypothetical protein [Amycolatopsis australiensis]